MIILPLVVMTLAVIVLGIAPGLIDWLTVPAAERLIVMFRN